MPNNCSALFWKASAIFSNPNWKETTFKEFKELGNIAKAKGFLLVSSSPLTRSSYHADEDFAKLQQNRLNNH